MDNLQQMKFILPRKCTCLKLVYFGMFPPKWFLNQLSKAGFILHNLGKLQFWREKKVPEHYAINACNSTPARAVPLGHGSRLGLVVLIGVVVRRFHHQQGKSAFELLEADEHADIPRAETQEIRHET